MRLLFCFYVLLLFMSSLTVSVAEQQVEKHLLSKKMLLDIVEDARQGDRDDLIKLRHALERPKRLSIAPSALSVIEPLLSDSDPELQLVGSMALHVLKDRKSKGTLVSYLKNRDFKKLNKLLEKGDIKESEYQDQIKASIYAVMTLGKIGDTSVVPLLQELSDVEDLKFEFGEGPVQQALAELGAVDVLSDVTDGSDHRKISRAARAVEQMKDPKKVPELISTAKDKKCAKQVRSAALTALGNIDDPGIPEFLSGLIQDQEVSPDLRKYALIVSGKKRSEKLEPLLLELAKDKSSDLRPYAVTGLALHEPDLYMKQWFEKILDEEEKLHVRERLIGIEFYFSRNLLRTYRDDLFRCLDAQTKQEFPADKIRVQAWRIIHELFSEEPPLVLSNRLKTLTLSLRPAIETEVMMANPHVSSEELQKKVDQKLDSVIRVYKPVGSQK